MKKVSVSICNPENPEETRVIRAFSKGFVLREPLVLSEGILDRLNEVNSRPQDPEVLAGRVAKQRALEASVEAQRKSNGGLPRYYDYDAKGNLRSRKNGK